MAEPVAYKGMSLVIPENDTEWGEFYAEARKHRLVMRCCGDCGLMRYPPGPGCPWCASLKWSWREVSGAGTIHSYEIVTQAIQAGFKDWVPYAVVLIELDEQRGQPTPDEALRIIANLLRPDGTPELEERIAIGKRVRVQFQNLTENMALPQFVLSDEPPDGRVWQFGG